MNACSPRNPNICLDCETLALDESPSTLAAQTEAERAPQGSVGSVQEAGVRPNASGSPAFDTTNSGGFF
jgi:hypothetical protein